MGVLLVQRITFLFLIMVLNGCVKPAYHRVSDGSEQLKGENINYFLAHDYAKTFPTCVAVVAKTDVMEHSADHFTGRETIEKSAEKSLARHLSDKFERVLFPRQTHKILSDLGARLDDEAGRLAFIRKSGCDYYAQLQVYDVQDVYVGFAAHKQIGISAQIKSLQDEQMLWQASHGVWRADGGVPISPFSTLGALVSATYFSQDDELIFSLTDDALRRMMNTLPAFF